MKPKAAQVKDILDQQDKDFGEGTYPGTDNESAGPEKIDDLVKKTYGDDAVTEDETADFDMSNELRKDERDQADDEENENPKKKEDSPDGII